MALRSGIDRNDLILTPFKAIKHNMTRIDLHVHSTLSPCGKLGISQILSHARARGLDGVCITDHDTMAAARQVTEGIQPDGLCLLVGAEYTTPGGDFLIFGPFDRLPPGLSAEALLTTVFARGGIAVAAHPFRAVRPAELTVFHRSPGPLIETRNGRNTAAENRRAERLGDGLGIPGTGGSDAHCLDELGRVVTHIERPVQSRSDLIAALRAGDCRAEWGLSGHQTGGPVRAVVPAFTASRTA